IAGVATAPLTCAVLVLVVAHRSRFPILSRCPGNRAARAANISGAAMKDKPVTPERIMQFWFSFAPPLMLEAAIRHRFFDTLDAGPKSAEQVAQATGASLRGTRWLLDALVGTELLVKKDGNVALTPECA